MKKSLLLLLFFLPITIMAQNNTQYLEGAVPVIDGRVIFTKEMCVNGMSKNEVYNTLLAWAKTRFQPKDKFNARILYQDPDEGNIAIAGEEYIVFTNTALSLDRSRIYYHIAINCNDEKCNISMNRIRYWYNETRDGGEKFNAEEWIIDEYALNKSKTKLYPKIGKFRRKTIDLKDDLFKEIQTALGNRMLELGLKTVKADPLSQVTVNEPQPTKTISQAPTISEPAKLDIETYIKQANRITITAGNDEQIEISKECWGGFGEMFGQKVAFCFIETQKIMANMLISQNENYRISFYTNNNQASVIINCKKLMTQTLNGEEAKKMNTSCNIDKSYNMYVGAVLK